MKRDFLLYESAWWKIDYPSDWTVEKYPECVSFYAEDGVGALQISSYAKDSEVTEEDLNELVADEIPENAVVKSVEIGNLEALASEFEYKNQFWRIWFLMKGKTLLYVTYNCELKDRGIEIEDIDRMLSRLVFK